MNLNFDSLKEQVSNLSLYDIKAGVRRVQNAVMNYTEMEAKVREATNNEPWGCPTSKMQEIVNGTYNYQLLNEIMPMIYKRFTEKSAEEWRQIYKALQLLEFLIKNGSERVIDDARSHLTLLKMLRQFHFIDANGKDQGMNVRNRARELSELLSDVDRIRAERKKARATRNKYGGVEGGAGLGSDSFSSGSRYGGFGSNDPEAHSSGTFGGYSGGVYGDGGGFGGQSSDYQDTQSRAERFEEYDEYDEGAVAAPGHRQSDVSGPRSRRTDRVERSGKKPVVSKKEPEVDLFSFDEPESTASTNNATPSTGITDDDDFDDFQSATPSTQTTAPLSMLAAPPAPTTTSTTTPLTQFASPQPISAPKAANLSEMVGMSSISPIPSSSNATPLNYSAFSPPATAQQVPRSTGFQASQPNYFTSVLAPGTGTAVLSPQAGPKPTAAKSSSGGDAFGSLWNTASAGIKKTNTPAAGPALGQLAKEKSSAGIWGPTATSSASTSHPAQSPNTSGKQVGEALDDLLG